jgi:hypothetical protein
MFIDNISTGPRRQEHTSPGSKELSIERPRERHQASEKKPMVGDFTGVLFWVGNMWRIVNT